MFQDPSYESSGDFVDPQFVDQEDYEDYDAYEASGDYPITDDDDDDDQDENNTSTKCL